MVSSKKMIKSIIEKDYNKFVETEKEKCYKLVLPYYKGARMRGEYHMSNRSVRNGVSTRINKLLKVL